MNFIKKIFENKIDDYVHLQFSRFGKGIFENKALLEINVSSKNVKIKTSAEFTNELVELLANTIKEHTKVKGMIFSTKDLGEESDIKFKEIKNAMGVKKHFVDQELTKEQILNLIKKFPKASLSLSFETDYGKLKIKEKAPRAAKPGKKGNAPKADYCTFVTSNKEILNDYSFDVNIPYKKLFIMHTYEIEELVIPEEYKNSFSLARIHAKRKGKLIRKILVDGKQIEKNILFEA